MDRVIKFSIITPAYNEEKIIEEFVGQATRYTEDSKLPSEIVIVENGSRDNTLKILRDLSRKNPFLKVLHLETGNKGMALRTGLLSAKGEYLITIDADLWDSSFIDNSLAKLQYYDIVVGSKTIKGAEDNRPVLSRLFSIAYNFMFKLFFNFKGTETHAKLSFRRDPITPIVKKCRAGDLVFDTELIIRAEREHLSKIEIPTKIVEIRPRVWSFRTQLVNTIKNFILLLRILGPTPNILYMSLILFGLFILIKVLFLV